ncbi:MAG: hypothetical protein WCG94_05265, partial [Methanothrix sp.]
PQLHRLTAFSKVTFSTGPQRILMPCHLAKYRASSPQKLATFASLDRSSQLRSRPARCPPLPGRATAARGPAHKRAGGAARASAREGIRPNQI